jgi:hypothetical protein
MTMKKMLLALFGVMGLVMVLFAFLPGKRKTESRFSSDRPEEPCWFCYPDAN